MSNQWFRFYTEVLNDPKVQCLDGETFKIWINILCVASKYNGTLPETPLLAFELRTTIEATSEALKRLALCTTLGSLLDEVKNQHKITYKIHGWNKRQYKSDTSTDRVKRYRNKNKTVSCNVSETPPEQIQNTDTEIKETKVSKKENLNLFKPDKIIFNYEIGMFENWETHLPLWKKAYPAIDHEREMAKAAAWLLANPQNQKQLFGKFLNSWLARVQKTTPKINGTKLAPKLPANRDTTWLDKIYEEQNGQRNNTSKSS